MRGVTGSGFLLGKHKLIKVDYLLNPQSLAKVPPICAREPMLLFLLTDKLYIGITSWVSVGWCMVLTAQLLNHSSSSSDTAQS